MSLEKDSPVHRPVQANGKIVSKPILGGLHHVYSTGHTYYVRVNCNTSNPRIEKVFREIKPKKEDG